MKNAHPLFVVGVYRSGTSLLCSILNQHPKVALMFECDVWNFPRPLLAARFRGNWAERIEFYNEALSRHRLVKDGDLSELQDIRGASDLYEAFGALKSAEICGEKSPFYCDRLVQLHQHYPNAIFIIVWRNPVEIYRSVLKAGETSRFFGKPGMLSRMIYQQEQLIRQAAQIERTGTKIFHVSYADLVDRTEKTCQELCAFLDLPYDGQMLKLNQADLSTIYKAPHHAYLRRGIIERQKYPRELIKPAIVEKLERYRRRWERLQANWLKPEAGSGPEPYALERVRHFFLGRILSFYDALVRAGFEFLPIGWLRLYRLLKNWVVNPPSGSLDEKISLTQDLKKNWPAISTASALFAGIAWVDAVTDPYLQFIAFYAVPALLAVLLVNLRWATLFVMAGSFTTTLLQYLQAADFHGSFIFTWNLLTRFVLLEMFILTVGRIRMELRTQEMAARPPAKRLTFSIITPSFRNSEWLKLCIASVDDQRKEVSLEHIVQDACSDDGTQTWLPHDPRVKAFIEKDQGMYDAVNRGYQRATGDILAYLNCDEQYLPGALATVEKFFLANPNIEVLLAGSIVTDGEGKYLCHRHSMVPDARQVWYRFPILTSGIFIRRKVITRRKIFFDTKWRDLGDFHWVLALMKAGVTMDVSNKFTSVFADTGENMNLKPNAIREMAETKKMIPVWMRPLKPLWILSHRFRRLNQGHFNLKATSYAIYTKANPDKRVIFDVPHPTPIWWNRL
jgi:glycosyltransferase involved in cell wall biosynthesis